MHKQQEYVSNSNDIFHRDMCNDIADGKFVDWVIKQDDKIVGYIFILSVKNDVFFGSVGDSCDFDIDCVVIEKKKNEEVISNQHMFVRKMALVEE
ncbi:MAG: hypothetical protein H9872_04520 [Candidatus Cellulosilyticum pullistercoris]|uniref:Uncharacterized protein n=1 Tax=Candidatus Cellulosilyticum pullistercoris TaxID=2838521 RepID=A0A9E2NKN5_9FIRM|nr:hypothetical protein [Candidatus Cellulosilyticum pullistercoris]